jgi:hypothetical protein
VYESIYSRTHNIAVVRHIAAVYPRIPEAVQLRMASHELFSDHLARNHAISKSTWYALVDELLVGPKHTARYHESLHRLDGHDCTDDQRHYLFEREAGRLSVSRYLRERWEGAISAREVPLGCNQFTIDLYAGQVTQGLSDTSHLWMIFFDLIELIDFTVDNMITIVQSAKLIIASKEDPPRPHPAPIL